MAESVQTLLERCGLGQYLRKFQAEEVDSLELMKALSEQDLTLLVPVPEHRILIRQELDSNVPAVDPVLAVLYRLHLQRYAAVFHSEEVIDLPTLCSLQDSELQALVPNPDDRATLVAEIARLQATISDPAFVSELAMKQLIESEKRKAEEAAASAAPTSSAEQAAAPTGSQPEAATESQKAPEAAKPPTPNRKPIGRKTAPAETVKLEDIQKMVKNHPADVVHFVGTACASYPALRDIFSNMIEALQNNNWKN